MLCGNKRSYTYLSKPVGKRSESTKSEVFLKDFLNKFHDIGKYPLLMHSHFLMKFFTKKKTSLFWVLDVSIINITPLI